MPESPSPLPQIRCELLNWFRNSAAPLAPAYEGAFRLLDAGEFPGRIHFIAHAVRDMCDRLIYVLDPQLKGNRVQYENEMDTIAEEWPTIHRLSAAQDERASNDGSVAVLDVLDEGQASAEVITILYRMAVRIDSLVRAHRLRRERPSNQELLFRFLMRREPTQGQVNERLVKDFERVKGWFMKSAHFGAGEPVQVMEGELQERFSAFERMLHSFVGSFFTTTKELDEILRQANH